MMYLAADYLPDHRVRVAAGLADRVSEMLIGLSALRNKAAILSRERSERSNHVWSYDFVADRTYDGKAFRMLCIIDEFTRKSLTIRVARKLKATDVIDVL
jgi:hypothetical protein